MAKQHRIRPSHTARARRLRRESTVPERLLWARLRAGGLGKLKFRRQHPVGPYVVDFYCAAASLAVEIDGVSHEEQEAHDEKRTAYLASRGLRVVRFTNDEVLADTDAVARTIAREAGAEW